MEGCTGKEMKRMYFACIDKLGQRFSVPWLCKLHGVSKSGYYRWKKAPAAPNHYEITHQQLDMMVSELHTRHPSYGYRSVCAVIV